MAMAEKKVTLLGHLGLAVSQPALIGFAPANVLHGLSFADVLNEDSGTGYQRRLNPQHSLDFRRYVQTGSAMTIPLTFNVRPPAGGHWRLIGKGPNARLEVDTDGPRVLAQVDCQHRLGHLHDLHVQLPFLCFIGLSARDEMEAFRVINSKAKGLSTSLLDYHDAQLALDLASERPELFIALQLNINADSPWRRQLDLGGEKTSGLTRRASLRTMQKAVRDFFLTPTSILQRENVEAVAAMVVDFWLAVTEVMPSAWSDPRSHLITKGVGVYALTGLMAQIYQEKGAVSACTRRAFRTELAAICPSVDWTGQGTFKGLGGESGAKEALRILLKIRSDVLAAERVGNYGR
jgi:DNA sulfur modification protein DndB